MCYGCQYVNEEPDCWLCMSHSNFTKHKKILEMIASSGTQFRSISFVFTSPISSQPRGPNAGIFVVMSTRFCKPFHIDAAIRAKYDSRENRRFADLGYRSISINFTPKQGLTLKTLLAEAASHQRVAYRNGRSGHRFSRTVLPRRSVIRPSCRPRSRKGIERFETAARAQACQPGPAVTPP